MRIWAAVILLLLVIPSLHAENAVDNTKLANDFTTNVKDQQQLSLIRTLLQKYIKDKEINLITENIALPTTTDYLVYIRYDKTFLKEGFFEYSEMTFTRPSKHNKRYNPNNPFAYSVHNEPAKSAWKYFQLNNDCFVTLHRDIDLEALIKIISKLKDTKVLNYRPYGSDKINELKTSEILQKKFAIEKGKKENEYILRCHYITFFKIWMNNGKCNIDVGYTGVI